jgi:hypothetical protein
VIPRELENRSVLIDDRVFHVVVQNPPYPRSIVSRRNVRHATAGPVSWIP